ncbi:endoplasmic reticulum chaperone GRP170 [Plasmodium brasilianum]|uniref:Heat shock protein 110, putative n=2 Tax=Plasmodium (Plasmodium) TaxID=418103 RepID=A0A1A8W722_PLAMA|nr:endoplasmic reticulum chaperone GRP170 [Plasmodium brasilianum]SBS87783.1 heat shock protein 110, putative [Plasmodium malariae]
MIKRTLILCLSVITFLNNVIIVKSSSLLGIDFGNEYIKVSIVSPGKGFNILLNNQSKRKISNAISFATKVRTFDEEAKVYSSKQPHLTLINSNNFLGYNIFDWLKNNKENLNIENYDENNEAFYSDINNYDFEHGDPASKYFAYDYVVDSKRGTINLKLKNDMVLSSEEVSANILGYIKKLAYTHLNIDYKTKRTLNVNIGCVISVPCNFSQRKKEAIVNASKIAGLELLSIVNGITAAAIHNVHDLPLNTTKLTMYLDVGSKNINVGIATISNVEKDKVRSRSVKVYACEVLENSSGNKIDVLLAEFLRKRFEEKHNISMINDRKAMRKLIISANKAKLLLSAKKSADIFIESLYNNKSLTDSVSRQEFEDLIHDIIMNFKLPINNALKKASFELKDIEALELIGSGWRVPKVLNEITNFFNPLKVGMHLNSDEAVTMGTLYIAAYNSANFRLKDLDYTDIISNEYHVLFEDSTKTKDNESSDEKNIQKELISYNSKYPVTKSVILKYRDNLKISVFENGKMITQYSVNPLDDGTKKKYENLDPPKIKLKFHLDKFGVLNMESMHLMYEEKKQMEGSEEGKENKEGKKDDKEDKNEDKKDDKEDKNEDRKDDKDSSEEIIEENLEKNEEQGSQQRQGGEENKDTDKTEKNKTQVVKHNVSLTYEIKHIKPMTLTYEEIKTKKEFLKKLDQNDINIFLKSEKKNNLESFIYESRSKMKQDMYKQVCKEEIRNEYLKKLEEYEEWLYIENDEPLENVSNKIRELEDIYIPVKERAEELQIRDKLIEETNSKIKEMKEKIKEYYEKKPWAEQTINVVRDSLEKEITWWIQAQEEQKKLDNYSPPYYKAKEVELKFKSINSLVKSLEKIKKPVVKKEKKEENKNTDETKTQNSSQENKENDKNNENNNEILNEKKDKEDAVNDNVNKTDTNTQKGSEAEEQNNSQENTNDAQEKKDEL